MFGERWAPTRPGYGLTETGSGSALVWAPDGSRLLVGGLNDQELITAFTPDGHRTTPLAGISDLVGQVAWQPVNCP